MRYNIKNNTGKDFSVLNGLIEKFFPYAQKNMGFDQPVTIVLESDLENAANPLGKTAYYSPSDNKVVLYTDNRHPKDLMRSLSHELVHHKQNCNGELSEITGEQGYAQTEVGYKIEEEAYSLGNTCFRNWEDSVKKQINETSYITKGDKKMKLTETKLREMVKEALKNVYLKEETINEEEKDLGEAHCAGNRDDNKKLDRDEEIQEKQFANDDSLDGDKDGIPKWADKDDPAIKKSMKDKKNKKEMKEEIVEVKKDDLDNWWNQSLYTNLVKKYTGGKK